MGQPESKGGQQGPPLGKIMGVSQNIPEFFRFIACDITPDDDEEGHAEISSWRSDRPGHFDSQVVDNRRPQPCTPLGARQRANNPGLSEGSNISPTRDLGRALGGASTWPGKKAANPFKSGDAVELWSKSQQAWCRGNVDKVEGSWVHVIYSGPEGQPMTKIMPNGHDELRLSGTWPLQGNDNVKLQNRSFPQGRDAGSWRDPGSSPAPLPPQWCDVPGHSPARSTQAQSPMPLEVPSTSPASASGQGPPSGGLFNLPAGDLMGAMRLRQMQQAPSTPQSTMAPKCFQASPGLTPAQSTPGGWQGSMGQSPAPSQGSLTLAPGALSTMASPCAASPPSNKKYEEPDVPNKVPLIAGIDRIEPEVVHQLLQSSQCVLIDLRGEDRAAGVIPDSIHVQAIDSVPFAQKIPGLLQRFQSQSLVVFTCQYSAHRAPQCANWYREQADPRQRVAIMSGGYRAWEGNGLPVESSGSGDKYAADAYALLQGVQFAQQSAGVGGGSYCQQRWV